MIDIIAFDADDTLWHQEFLYQRSEQRLQELLSAYQPSHVTERTLFEIEMRNQRLYGFGIKGFALSMIETAIRLSDGRIGAGEIGQIIDLAKGMIEAPVELLDGVAEVIPALAKACRLMVITKGDLRDQEAKLAQSGLAPYFSRVEIVAHKTVETYRALLARHGLEPQRFLMVGNSLRSDVLPVLELGGWAVHIPHPITWAHEVVDPPADGSAGYLELEHIGQLPELVKALCRGGRP